MGLVQPNISTDQQLTIRGARVHNLKNVDVDIPRNQLVVITGLSGSGKSSLAFDVIYAEGQRRYIETFSAYARQFIGNLERPDVDKITGLSPVISIEQKTVNKNPRSTVGTITDIYDFLRLLYARVADAYSYETGKKMVKYTESQIRDLIVTKFTDTQVLILAPVVRGRKGHYKEHFEKIRSQGFLKARVDGQIREITYGFKVDRYKVHDIEIVIDKIQITDNEATLNRLSNSIQTAMKYGKGSLIIVDAETSRQQHFSKSLMCVDTGISYDEPEPNTFSFNSGYGACARCNGLGTVHEIDLSTIIPDTRKSIRQGGIIPLGTIKSNWIFKQIEAIGKKFGFNLNTPIIDIPEEAMEIIMNGTDSVFTVKHDEIGVTQTYSLSFDGIVPFIANQFSETPSPAVRKWAEKFMNQITCPSCGGSRLKKESLHFLVNNKNIAQLASMDLLELSTWASTLLEKLDTRKQTIAKEILREITTRLSFLLEVGLDYLSLNRTSRSLSGGESQRIRLASQIGSQLTGVLYILDEPSIGLHQRDNQRVIQALHELRDIGNSVIVVEHDLGMMEASDYIIDLGPRAGRHGGQIVAQGKPEDFVRLSSLTSDYLCGRRSIEMPAKRRKAKGREIVLKNASGNNLKEVTLRLPLGVMTCVTGVSGSGKSTLINETLYPILSQTLYGSEKPPLPYGAVTGIEQIDKVIEIDQSPIGRTPRSNPATYTGVFGDIRELFVVMPESKIRGYKPGRFSFNVKGGRCEVCKGAGVKTIEMNFLPDVYVQCDACMGKRYNRETLEVRYRGKSINDVLNLTINQAVEFFENIPKIEHKLIALQDVGLGYITLGQQSTTLSGGEAQRVKLSSELVKKDTGKTLYILDEPSTGLHFEDIRVLLKVLNKLVEKGNTVVIIEHNLDIIKMADYIVDMGPEGGRRGGQIIALGTPEQVAAQTSHTAQFLKTVIDREIT